MLSDEQRCVLSLLRQSMGIKPVPCADDDLDASKVVSIIRRNGILLTVYPQLEGLPQVQDALRQQYYATVSQSVTQSREGERVLRMLSNAGMRCIALKGWEMRALYPREYMRQMADIDILVSPYDYERLRSAMESLSYTACVEESSWKHDSFAKNSVNFEMHKRLTDDSRRIQEWERGIWDRANCVYENVWRMSNEDYYLFHIVHMHKDICNGSLGLRRIVDTWLLDRRDGLDEAYVEYVLQKIGLASFRWRMSRLSRVCMGEEPLDNDSEVLLRHAFTCGIYGNGKSYKAGRIVMMSGRGGLVSGKIKSAIAAVFLPYGRMKAQFPELERWPVLLPVCWGRRIAHFLHEGQLGQYSKMLDYGDISKQDYKEMRQVLEAAGCL